MYIARYTRGEETLKLHYSSPIGIRDCIKALGFGLESEYIGKLNFKFIHLMGTGSSTWGTTHSSCEVIMGVAVAIRLGCHSLTSHLSARL